MWEIGRALSITAVRVHIHKKIQQINAEYTSKVASLQALLRKAFRSPGALVLGDFGIFCLFFSCEEKKAENSSLVCLARVVNNRRWSYDDGTCTIMSVRVETLKWPTTLTQATKWGIFVLFFSCGKRNIKLSRKFRSHLGPVPQVSGRLCEAKPEAKSPWKCIPHLFVEFFYEYVRARLLHVWLL